MFHLFQKKKQKKNTPTPTRPKVCDKKRNVLMILEVDHTSFELSIR